MIAVSNLRKAYGTLVAVDGVSFEIREGETFGLLGPNGAGKSTTINIMTGLVAADAGHVEIGGQRDPRVASVRRQIGTVPQTIALYDQLTAEENLRFFGRIYGVSGGRLAARIDAALALTGLTDRRRSLVSTYSGGMKRRLNIACSLLHEPSAIFFDEPTVGVDPQSRNLIFDNIESLRREGRTILYTTHYMEEAERLCDRVAIMDRGRILALDTVGNLIAAHGGDSVIEAVLTEAPRDAATFPGTLEGDRLTLRAADPLAAVASLATAGLQIASLKVERASLEDVFLTLTGRTLRD